MTAVATDVALRMEGVRKTYRVGDAEVVALDGVDLTVGADEIVAGDSDRPAEAGCLGDHLIQGMDMSRSAEARDRRHFLDAPEQAHPAGTVPQLQQGLDPTTRLFQVVGGHAGLLSGLARITRVLTAHAEASNGSTTP